MDLELRLDPDDAARLPRLPVLRPAGRARSQPLRIVFLVKERNSDTRALGKLQVTDTDPARVTSSEINAIAPGAAVIGYDIDATTRTHVIDGAIEKIDEFYVFPDIAKKMAIAVRARAKRANTIQ